MRSADYLRLIDDTPGLAAGIEAHADHGARPALAVPVSGAGRPLAMVGGAYEGASRWARELAMWNPAMRSADLDILPSKDIANSRSRDMVRNDAFYTSGSNIHKDNIVGSLYRLNAKPEWKILGLDEVWATEFQEEVEAKFTLWAESDSNWVDASRYNTFTSLLRLGVGVYLMGGEVLASVEWLRDGPRPYSTAIQMIELERLSNPPGMIDGPDLRGGVAKNMYGAPQGYWIRLAHPADFYDPDINSFRFVKTRKPWGRLQMIHIVEQTRVDQTRGISDMVSSLKEGRTAKKFRDIVLQNAILNATYAASIESELPSEAAFASIGGGNISENIVNYTGAYLSAVSAYAGDSKAMYLDGVKVPHLFPGTKLQLRPAGQGGPLGTDFENSLLRYIAANLGVSFEQLSRDYSKANYSSIRASMTETWKFMQGRKRMVADRMASQIYTLWLEEAINSRDITSLPRRAVDMFYNGLGKEAFSACEWVGASRGQIDELKETQAATLRLKYNLSTYEDEQARLGKDWRQQFAQIAREKDMMKKLGIELVDPNAQSAMNAASGDSHVPENVNDPNSGDNTGDNQSGN